MSLISTKELSIVIPMFNESEGIDALFAALIPQLDKASNAWEILCVNDGSRDDTLKRLQGWNAKDRRINIISLSRNFGKEAALTAGLHHANGQAVIPFDADLQDPPELIPELVAEWRKGFKVVLATRNSREGDSYIKRTTADWFYKLMQAMHVNLPSNTGDFRLMDASVVAVLRLLPERTRFMKGLFAWVGFSTTQVYYERKKRTAGEPKQNYRKLINLAKDGIFSFTTLPLRLTMYLGLIISLVAFTYAFWLIIRVWIFGVDVPGYASIMAAILTMGGIQLVALGIIGEYLGRIYRETKQRPLFIIEQKIGL